MKRLPIVVEEEERTALSARWPEPVLVLSDEERAARVRQGRDTVLLHEAGAGGVVVTRGFVRAVLRVPLGHPKASVYGVFVEVDKDAYAKLKQAFADKKPTSVWGTLATRLPFIEDAFGSAVEVLEDGGELRARVVDAKSSLIVDGPPVGRR